MLKRDLAAFGGRRPHRSPRRRGRRHGRRQPPLYDLGGWLRSYCIAITLLMLVMIMVPLLGLLAYLPLGLWLSRRVLGNARWIAHRATVGTIARDKAGFIVAWPLAFPKLFCVVWLARRG